MTGGKFERVWKKACVTWKRDTGLPKLVNVVAPNSKLKQRVTQFQRYKNRGVRKLCNEQLSAFQVPNNMQNSHTNRSATIRRLINGCEEARRGRGSTAAHKPDSTSLANIEQPSID
jgi:hypothetical protein